MFLRHVSTNTVAQFDYKSRWRKILWMKEAKFCDVQNPAKKHVLFLYRYTSWMSREWRNEQFCLFVLKKLCVSERAEIFHGRPPVYEISWHVTITSADPMSCLLSVQISMVPPTKTHNVSCFYHVSNGINKAVNIFCCRLVVVILIEEMLPKVDVRHLPSA